MPEAVARQRYEEACRRIDWAMQELLAATDEKARAQLEMAGQTPASPVSHGQTSNLPRMRTIAECVQELRDQDPGARVTAYTIKRLINNGDVTAVKNGRTTLVNLDSLCECLRNPPRRDESASLPYPAGSERKRASTPTVRGIRAVPE